MSGEKNQNEGKVIILGIESSCDDTAASVCIDGKIISNVVAGQKVHENYGGVVPELASRAHLSHFIPTVQSALDEAGVTMQDLSAIAVTHGPGLLGSLVVGVCGARGLAAGLDIPIIGVHHMDAHILACFIEEPVPMFPFLCLTVSGGHSQLTIVRAVDDMEIIGRTLDDAAGEAFDKVGKIIGLPYPAGPYVDKLAQGGEDLYGFTRADIPNYDFSFSGLKTQVLYFLRNSLKQDEAFIENNKPHIAASVQQAIVDMLMDKLVRASKDHNINEIAIAGGVSANSGVRSAARHLADRHGWTLHIPSLPYCTDNAAMISIAGYYKYRVGVRDDLGLVPFAR